MKIVGDAEACGRGQEGSGSVVGPQRVVTNAHVVAGVDAPTVQVSGVGERLPARVVLFDPQKDVAVLAVPNLTAPALPLASRDLQHGDDAVVAGFPKNGPFSAGAARVRNVLSAVGEDIYGKPGVTREVYSLYANVQQGNSGGPLLDTSGRISRHRVREVPRRRLDRLRPDHQGGQRRHPGRHRRHQQGLLRRVRGRLTD